MPVMCRKCSSFADTHIASLRIPCKIHGLHISTSHPYSCRGSVSTESHALPKAAAFSSKYNLCYQRYYLWFVRTLQTMLVLLCFYLASPTCFRQKEEETGHQAKGKAQPMLRMSVSVKLPVPPAEGNQWGGWFVIRGN